MCAMPVSRIYLRFAKAALIVAAICASQTVEAQSGICGRTEAVRNAILAHSQLPANIDDCASVTSTHLAQLTSQISLTGLTGLTSGDFSGLSALESLSIGSSPSLSSLPAGIFSGLTSVTTLTVSRTGLTALPDNAFTSLTAAESVSIRSNSDLATIGQGGFSAMTKATRLYLDNNAFASLPSGAFSGLEELTTLWLHRNSITSLPSGIFSGLAKLETLNLSSNKLTSLPTNPFSGLAKLNTLNLSSNPALGSLRETDFQGVDDEGDLAALENLNLGNTGLSSLPEDIFDGLATLQQLGLYRNSLTALPEDVFDGLTALETLRLNSNILARLPEDVFDGLSNLVQLWMHDNKKLRRLPADVFDGLSNLKELNIFLFAPSEVDLDHPELYEYVELDQGLKSLPAGIFEDLTSLVTLNLGYNSISSLPDGVFHPLVSLKTLGLHGNGLTALQEDALEGLSGLGSLRMYTSRLKRFPEGILEGLSGLGAPRADPDLRFRSGLHTDALPILITAEAADGGFKLKAHAGAPFDITVPFSVVNGTVTDGSTSATIPAGSVESPTVPVTSTSTLFAVIVEIGTLPDLPQSQGTFKHQGYYLAEPVDGRPAHVVPGAALSLSLSPDSVAEGASETTVTLTASHDGTAISSPIDVTVAVAGGTATPGRDYAAISAGITVTIPATHTSGTGTVTFTPIADSLAEGDETVVLAATATGLAGDQAILLLIDDDYATSSRDKGPPAITLWTDKLGYEIDETTRVYLDIDPRGDEREYSLFVCRENIETGERFWLAPWTGTTALHEPVVDYYGRTGDTRLPGRLRPVEKELIWEGRVPEPGLWHFVLELRSPDTAQIGKTAFAKFVVARKGSRLLSRRGTRRIIAEDTRLTSDRVYHLGGQLHVKRGATLTIDAGTLIKAHDPSAAIVVEPGARIVARGRREAPIVMTCWRPVGKRRPGCWGGLRVFGRATEASGPALAGSAQPDRAVIAGGASRRDSSGELRYLRVEFAGGASVHGARSAGILLDGVGSGTVLDHVQVHASLGDGIVIQGGDVHCSHCVASEVRRDSLVWRDGWRGSAQFVYIQQGAEATCGIRGHSPGPSIDPAIPALWNVTLVGGYNIGTLGGIPGSRQSIGPGVLLEKEAAFTAGNLLATGFAGLAIDGSAASFSGGRSRIDGAFLSYTGYGDRRLSQVSERFEPYVNYLSRDPDLRNVPYGANPDPRPRSGSEALRFVNAAMPPHNGRFTRSAYHVGAFGTRNWLAEWTFFGPESDYEVPNE